MRNTAVIPLELLAPARDVEIARQAILHGADAVYIGGPSHSARSAASNKMEDIAQLVEWAHKYKVKIYLTLNTIFFDNEAKDVERIVKEAWSIGVDALIVQDMGILRLDIPAIDLHASTQCDIRTPDKAEFLAYMGFSQLVLARELSLKEIKAIREVVPKDVKLEAFVHGALCVSYSGDCQASCVANGRSANRGECAQMCRMAYDLVDSKGKVWLRNRHVLSLQDLYRLDHLEELANAGISSFKIEGRLKDAGYVKNVVAAYRRELDRIIKSHPEKYCKASIGDCIVDFEPDVNKTFNRGYTRYFIDGRPQRPVSMANLDTPKWIGEKVGKVEKTQDKFIVATLDKPLSNGDGLGYYDSKGQFCGFRLNRIEGNKLFPAIKVDIKAGTVLYRNNDAQYASAIAKNTASRKVKVNMRLWQTAWGIALEIDNEYGYYGVATAECELQKANSPQLETRKNILSKLGDTIYELNNLEDGLGDDNFNPASVLTQLRREAISILNQSVKDCYQYSYCRAEDKDVKWPGGIRVSYHDNVSNGFAETFYREHGVEEIQKALECGLPKEKTNVVMTTRYCLRRELGACLREGGAKKLPEPLYIRNKAVCYGLNFDCEKCQMQIKYQR